MRKRVQLFEAKKIKYGNIDGRQKKKNQRNFQSYEITIKYYYHQYMHPRTIHSQFFPMKSLREKRTCQIDLIVKIQRIR